MNLDKANAVADAVLYEGHILYPYRPTAGKNRVRWTFGGVHPRAYSEASGGLEACEMQVQCLVDARPAANVSVRVRFLHLVHRQVLRLLDPVADLPAGALPPAEAVDTLEVSGTLLQTWEEAEERTLHVDAGLAGLLSGANRRVPIDLPPRSTVEVVRDGTGQVVAILAREQQALVGEVVVRATSVGDGISRLTVRVVNETPLDDAASARREAVMRSSLVSTHAVLGVEGGRFISLANPPEHLADLARACRQTGAWPVMIGDEGDADVVLATPIILEDYPQIAPESDTALFDSTEIDEILLLRIMTMTDDEKAEARQADPAVAALLDRADSLTADDLMRMHGTTRSLRPSAGLV